MTEAGSGIEGMRDDSAFTRYVAQALTAETMKLVDVGCAGGLPRGLRATFGDRLAAVAFDCDRGEVERLQAEEANPLVSYVSGYVGLPEGHPLRTHQGRRYSDRAYWHLWVDHRLSHDRTYALRRAAGEKAAPQSIEDYYRDVVLPDTWNPQPLSGFDLDYLRAFEVAPPDDKDTAAAKAAAASNGDILLPAYLQAVGFDDVDFLKIDVDGPDYDILRSAGPLLERTSLLGAAIEVSFYGSHDANDNSFHNVDRLMREKGFDLFGLSVRKYSAAALPARYMDLHPSMTVEGRPVQGDAIYLRDLSSRARKAEARSVSDDKLLKLAGLFALCTLPDYAAELLIVHRERLAPLIDVEHALDLLAFEAQRDDDRVVDYRQYMAEFEADHDRFYDEYGKKSEWLRRILHESRTAPGERDEARARLAAAEAALEAAQSEIAALRQEVEQLRHPAQDGGFAGRLGKAYRRLKGAE